MKITVFYSWQSDLEKKCNRNFIESAIKKAIKNMNMQSLQKNDIVFTSDSRGEAGTPDLSTTIFDKIDKCDIFIADISIINSESQYRIMPNPNVLVELGYAARSIGWSKIICVYNQKFAPIENLPFDIRGRKPIVYNSDNDLLVEKTYLTKMISDAMLNIIEACYADNKEYLTTKRNIDSGMQAVLIDFCQLLFWNSANNIDKYNYSKLLLITREELEKLLKEKEFLGFYLKRNISESIDDFINMFNDRLEVLFLSEDDKRIIAKMIFALRECRDTLNSSECFIEQQKEDKYVIVAGKDINPNNPKSQYLLLQPCSKGEAIVIAGGSFDNKDVPKLLRYYRIADGYCEYLAQSIASIANCVNLWIKQTGNYFIANL